MYEEPHPTTWDYSLPSDSAAGQQPAGWGYYDEPQRLAPDRADAFWDSFTGPAPDAAPDPAYGPAPDAAYGATGPVYGPTADAAFEPGPQPAFGQATGPQYGPAPHSSVYAQPAPPYPPTAPPYPPLVPPASPYPPQAAQPAPRQPTSHRLVSARPAVRGRRGLQGTLVGAAALLVLACGGGAYAIVTSLTGHAGNRSGTNAAGPATSAAAQSSPLTPSASPAGSGAAASATASPTPTSASSGPAPSGTSPGGTGSSGADTPSTAPADTKPGTITVAVSSAARQDPAEPTVAAWLSRYFAAINTHDYQAYIGLLDAQEAANESRSDFTSGYGTTTDSAASLASISDLSGGDEAVTISFTSHQSPAQSVNDSSCDRWTITIYLEPSGGSYVTVPPPAGYHSSYASC